MTPKPADCRRSLSPAAATVPWRGAAARPWLWLWAGGRGRRAVAVQEGGRHHEQRAGGERAAQQHVAQVGPRDEHRQQDRDGRGEPLQDVVGVLDRGGDGQTAQGLTGRRGTFQGSRTRRKERRWTIGVQLHGYAMWWYRSAVTLHCVRAR